MTFGMTLVLTTILYMTQILLLILLIPFSPVAQNFTQEPSSNNFTQDPIRNLNSNILKLTISLHLNPTSTNEINKIIQSLKTKDSHGYDEISSRILKISTPCILSSLTYIRR